MSHSRSPLYDPIIPPQAQQPKPEAKRPPISPIASYVGENNMILVWTMLAIVAFVAFVIFYIVTNPLPELPEKKYSIDGDSPIGEIASVDAA